MLGSDAGSDAMATLDASTPTYHLDASTDREDDGGADLEFRVDVARWHVILSAVSDATLYVESCTATRLSKKQGNDWVPPRDERPSHGGPYYQDGELILDQGFGCDALACGDTGGEVYGGYAMEYVQTGTRPPPAGGDVVPVIEKRPLHGELRVSLTYSTDVGGRCKGEQAFVYFAIPD